MNIVSKLIFLYFSLWSQLLRFVVDGFLELLPRKAQKDQNNTGELKFGEMFGYLKCVFSRTHTNTNKETSLLQNHRRKCGEVANHHPSPGRRNIEEDPPFILEGTHFARRPGKGRRPEGRPVVGSVSSLM